MRIEPKNASFRAAALALLWVVVPAAYADVPASPAEDPRVAAGRAIYRYYCYQCHGYAGDARTLASSYLAPPPRDFTATAPEQLPLDRIVQTLAEGRPGTAMVSFATVLDEAEAEAVALYIGSAFLREDPVPAYYHSPENGWADHERYAAAFPFVLGEIPLARDWDGLTPRERQGRRLYETACVSCHDLPGAGAPDDEPWAPRAVSYPRRHFSPRVDNADLVSGASPYARHDVAPEVPGLEGEAARGKRLYEANCAFCHAADGTGRNWIGSFLEPRPRDLTASDFDLREDPAGLAARIRAGLPGTSMPAWGGVLADGDIDAIVAYLRAAFAPEVTRAD
ncbi:MAG: c-type cytochrome [Gammaproteobacteria bacterium]|nr:c-type cytochrome [Gammaproteobacteria bacterium]MDH4253181.1 c-type cytochrome [Gammaproteobacteria bacterium]MDH5308457.1 c-type cytochrome [Gammaproteobacteria bacterium]